ncbi:hypothetical protein L873DRAFT_615839 [Choiromyces venosus 120613-1]|uniref:Uncharacterized protein n=1 Tax=Choiromyces venosus 120613-1 TaxID=1336337 RepID=A0A3N4IXK3_9PEZI|nr:hypothetical protein L873DRAFT_615839 [Choiromyces venosus 120613-1]
MERGLRVSWIYIYISNVTRPIPNFFSRDCCAGVHALQIARVSGDMKAVKAWGLDESSLLGLGREGGVGVSESGHSVSGVVEVPLAVPVPECSQSYDMAFLQEKSGAPPTLLFFKLPVSTRMCAYSK